MNKEEFIEKLNGQTNVCININDFVDIRRDHPELMKIKTADEILNLRLYASYNGTNIYISKDVAPGQIIVDYKKE